MAAPGTGTVHLLLEVGTGLLYFLVAWMVARRPTPARLINARDAFATWWFILGCLTLLGLILQRHEFSDGSYVPVFAAFTILLLVTGGSASLVYYQTVLLGRMREPGRLIAAYYTLVLGVYFGAVLAAGPRIDSEAGSIVYNQAWLAPGGILHPVLTVSYFWALLGPGLIGAAVLLWRTDRIRDTSVRDRAYTIGAALFIWYVFVLVGSISLLSGAVPPWLTTAARLVNLFAVLTVFIAIQGALRESGWTRPLSSSNVRPGPGSDSPWIGPEFTSRGLSAEVTPRRVMLVDDERDILDTLGLTIEAFCRVPVELVKVSDPQEAVRLVDEEHFDLVMSDYRMPGLTGADVLEHVFDVSPDTVRVLLTGYAEHQVVDDAIERGRVHGYELKPWDTKALLERLEAWLTEPSVALAQHDQVFAFLERSEALV